MSNGTSQSTITFTLISMIDSKRYLIISPPQVFRTEQVPLPEDRRSCRISEVLASVIDV